MPHSAAQADAYLHESRFTGPGLPSHKASQLFFSLYDDRARKWQFGCLIGNNLNARIVPTPHGWNGGLALEVAPISASRRFGDRANDGFHPHATAKVPISGRRPKRRHLAQGLIERVGGDLHLAGKGVVERKAKQQGNGDKHGQGRGHENLRQQIGRAEEGRIA